MPGTHKLPLGLRYDAQEIQIVAHENGTVDLWRHDGEASAEVYEDLSTDWLSHGKNELGEEVKLYHDDRNTAIEFAVNLITCYHLHWSSLGMREARGTAPPITGRSNRGNAARYRQQDH